MKSYSNLISLAVIFILLFALLGCFGKKNYTGQVPTVITDAESTGGSKVGYSWTVSFSYTINGRTYKGTSHPKIRHQVGTQGKACYMPSKPEKAYFALPNEVCGQ